MKTLVAKVMLGALQLVSKRLFEWVTDPERAQRLRFAHRKKWWAFLREAQEQNCHWKMRVATWYGILWKFETPPDHAVKRGDLNPPAPYPAH